MSRKHTYKLLTHLWQTNTYQGAQQRCMTQKIKIKISLSDTEKNFYEMYIIQCIYIQPNTFNKNLNNVTVKAYYGIGVLQ